MKHFVILENIIIYRNFVLRIKDVWEVGVPADSIPYANITSLTTIAVVYPAEFTYTIFI